MEGNGYFYLLLTLSLIIVVSFAAKTISHIDHIRAGKRLKGKIVRIKKLSRSQEVVYIEFAFEEKKLVCEARPRIRTGGYMWSVNTLDVANEIDIVYDPNTPYVVYVPEWM